MQSHAKKKALPESIPEQVGTVSAYLKWDKSPTVKGLQKCQVLPFAYDADTINVGTLITEDKKSTIKCAELRITDDSRITIHIIISSRSIHFKIKIKNKTSRNWACMQTLFFVDRSEIPFFILKRQLALSQKEKLVLMPSLKVYGGQSTGFGAVRILQGLQEIKMMKKKEEKKKSTNRTKTIFRPR